MRARLTRKRFGYVSLLTLVAVLVAVAVPVLADSATAPPADQLIVSPCEGFFYVGENPGDPPLVQVGDAVSPDMIVGYVQSMEKVPVRAGVYGTVLEVLVVDLEPVSTGQPLFVVSFTE